VDIHPPHAIHSWKDFGIQLVPITAGILIAFLARHNPLAIIPMAVLVGGISASGGLVQRRMGLPDATVLVLQSMIFLSILTSETIYGRMRWFQPREAP